MCWLFIFKVTEPSSIPTRQFRGPSKRSRGFTGECVKPTTTSSRNAAPLTTHETEKSALTDVSLSPVARVTHGFHPRAAGTHDGGSPTDASPSQPDTKKCIQVGRDTYSVEFGAAAAAASSMLHSRFSLLFQSHHQQASERRYASRRNSLQWRRCTLDSLCILARLTGC